MKEFAGREGFYWWHGVVEDIGDPLRLGRCRVRIFGYHTDNLLDLPTADLPWAYPMQPITSATISGIGQSPTGLLVGSHVFGFFICRYSTFYRILNDCGYTNFSIT